MVGGGHLRVKWCEGRQAGAARWRREDTLVFTQGRTIRLVRVVALATRRGPASEAATLLRGHDAAVRNPRPGSARDRRRKVRRDAAFFEGRTAF